MGFKEPVERKIRGETNELNRRKELWRKVVIAYEEGGQDEIKSILAKHGDKITKKFEELLEQLKKKL